MKGNRRLVLLVLSLMLLINSMAFAGDIQSSVIFTGMQKLIKDATTALMIIAPILGALLIGFFFLKKSAVDEMEQKTWQKRINTAIYSVIGVELASIIINLFVGYFK
ncbi:MAG: hypothetical protein WC983_09895 [Tissierellaceae bacterium]